MDELEVLEYSSPPPPLPNAELIASETSEKIEFGKFKIFSSIELPTNEFIYGGIGRMTSYRQVFANPSLDLILDRNKFGENAIRIFSVSLRKLYLLLHQQMILLVTLQQCPIHLR